MSLRIAGLYVLLNTCCVMAQTISCGAEATIFIDSNSTLVGCGENSTKILLSEAIPMISMWTKLDKGGDWRAISLGSQHCSGIKRDGTLWSWGLSNYRLPGADSVTLIDMPTQIGDSRSWRDVYSGFRLTYAIDSTGALWGWGFNNARQISDSTTSNIDDLILIDSTKCWRMIASSGLHTLALTCDGELYGWGLNHEGELGVVTDSIFVSKPVRIGDQKWISVSTGFIHSMGITSDSTLLTWGSNDSRQLGIGSKKNPIGEFNRPLPDLRFRYCNAGPSYSFAITTSGLVYAWGYSSFGQTGILSESRYVEKPTQISIPEPVESIVSTKGYVNSNGIAGFHSAAITFQGKILVTGSNYCGQLGLIANKQAPFVYATISDTSKRLSECAEFIQKATVIVNADDEIATIPISHTLCDCDSFVLYDIYGEIADVEITPSIGGCEFEIDDLDKKWYFLRYLDKDGSIVRIDADLRSE